MNSKKLYREYLKSLGCDCEGFISLEDDWYEAQIIYYKDSDGAEKSTTISVKSMLKWVFKSFNNKVWEGYIGGGD